MSTVQRSRWCRTCEARTLHQKETMGGTWGCLLVIMSGGLFLPFWLLIDLLAIGKPYRCQRCGRKRRT